MEVKPKRSPKSHEDKILGMVFNRLKKQLKFRYEDMSEWCSSQGKYVSVSSLHDMSGGVGIGYLSRIPVIARYFREFHGLEYVTEAYLLQGSEEEQEMIKQLKKIDEQVSQSVVVLPFEEFANQESA